MKQTLILGNIITMDEKRPFATNMAVFDTDFLHDDIEKVGRAKLIATVVDGEEVFKA